MNGRHPFWTLPEITIVRSHYPTGGLDACMKLLPNRSRASIYQRAAMMALRAPGQPNVRQNWPQSDRIDAMICQLHQQPPHRGAVMELADTLQRPQWWISRRARELGLITPRFKESWWTDAELELLHETAHLSTRVARSRFIARGFIRSETAIEVKRKRVGVGPSDNGVWNANQIAVMLGTDRKTVSRWIALGELKAKRRDDDKRYDIREVDLRAFIIACPLRVDLRKIPPPNHAWFIELLGGRAAMHEERKAA